MFDVSWEPWDYFLLNERRLVYGHDAARTASRRQQSRVNGPRRREGACRPLFTYITYELTSRGTNLQFIVHNVGSKILIIVIKVFVYLFLYVNVYLKIISRVYWRMEEGSVAYLIIALD